MEFKIEPATAEDAAELTEVFLKAFSDDFNQRLFPPTEDVRAWFIKQFTRDAEEAASKGTIALLKAVSVEGNAPVIAAFAKWKLPQEVPATADEGEETHHPTWPPSSDPALCDSFFTAMEQEHNRVMGNKKHYYLDMLGTNPDFSRLGLGAKLLNWGLARADSDGVLTFLNSSPYGQNLYSKHGFQAIRKYEVAPGYFQTSMVRPALATEDEAN